MNRRSFGDSGERIAARHLISQGMEIIGTNIILNGGEIDIIAIDGETVVFVEVKTRRLDFTRPAEAVTPAKIRRICRAAVAYLAGRGWLERDVRFDVMEIYYEGTSLETMHIRAAFNYVS